MFILVTDKNSKTKLLQRSECLGSPKLRSTKPGILWGSQTSVKVLSLCCLLFKYVMKALRDVEMIFTLLCGLDLISDLREAVSCFSSSKGKAIGRLSTSENDIKPCKQTSYIEGRWEYMYRYLHYLESSPNNSDCLLIDIWCQRSGNSKLH